MEYIERYSERGIHSDTNEYVGLSKDKNILSQGNY